MKQIVLACLLCVIGCTSGTGISSLGAGAPTSAGGGSADLRSALLPHIEGQILVRFNDGVESDTVSAILQQFECEVLTRYNDSQLYHLSLPTGLSVTDAVSEFASLEEVAFVEPNYVLRTEPFDI